MATGSPSHANLSGRNHRLLFIVLLLVGQFSLILHQLDYDQHAGGDACTICLAAQGLDEALPAASIPLLPGNVSEPPGVLPVCTPVSRTPAHLVARSPPLSALHA